METKRKKEIDMSQYQNQLEQLELQAEKNKWKNVRENMTHFKLDKSNIKFIELGNGIVLTPNPIIINEGEPIPVNEETRELVCVGNTSK